MVVGSNRNQGKRIFPLLRVVPDFLPRTSKRFESAELFFNLLYFTFLRRNIAYTNFFGESGWQHVCFKWNNDPGHWKLLINGEMVKYGDGFQIGKVFAICIIFFVFTCTCKFSALVFTVRLEE